MKPSLMYASAQDKLVVATNLQVTSRRDEDSWRGVKSRFAGTIR